MPVTQKQIADHLGLSPQAVNFALGRRANQVSAETRRRVMEAARRLGYRTNAAAQAVSTGRFNAVGLLMSRHHCQSTLFGHMLRGLHDALDARSIHLTVNFVDDDRLTSDDDLPKILGQSMVDGLLLNYTHAIPPRMADLIRRHRLPAVWINSRQPANCVYPDDEGAAATATRRLLDAGHRRIMYLALTAAVEDAAEPHYSHAARRDGYEKAMRDAGHEPLALLESHRLTFEKPVRAAKRILTADARPTAVVAYCRHDTDALSLAAAELGLKIGRDLSLITFEQDQPLVGPKIDTMRLPELAVGQAAGAMLLDRLDDPAADQPAVAVPMIETPGHTVWPVTET